MDGSGVVRSQAWRLAGKRKVVLCARPACLQWGYGARTADPDSQQVQAKRVVRRWTQVSVSKWRLSGRLGLSLSSLACLAKPVFAWAQGSARVKSLQSPYTELVASLASYKKDSWSKILLEIKGGKKDLSRVCGQRGKQSGHLAAQQTASSPQIETPHSRSPTDA